MSELLDKLLAKPVGAGIQVPKDVPKDAMTKEVEINSSTAAVTLRGEEDDCTSGAAAEALQRNGQDPSEWEVVGVRTSEWTLPSGELGTSARFQFKRKVVEGSSCIDDLLAVLDNHVPTPPMGTPFPSEFVSEWAERGMIVAIGDMQFGKSDGDGTEGTLKRTLKAIDNAVHRLWIYRERYHIEHVHIAWLGDHVEGFVSQSGANAWRTTLTLNEQIRLTRRVMLYAMLQLAPHVKRLTMAAVPGNHGESVRFSGKGVTRYDDSHDTESLIAVMDAAELNKELYGHVEFYVPDTDELTVLLDVCGTKVAHWHGHQHNPGKHFDWWRKQAFNKASAFHHADLGLAGHLHHEFVDTDGPRTFVQVPSMESESTWFRHRAGTPGNPGLMVLLTADGETNIKEVVRGS